MGNYKSALQERLQAERAGAPVYRVKSESGPDHRKRFLVEVRLKTAEGEPGKPLARGSGTTKKHAEQDAARRALARLDQAPSTTVNGELSGNDWRRRRDGMSTPAQFAVPPPRNVASHIWHHLPTVPEALASLMRTIVVALFLLTFVLQPFLIPSESMEHTLLVGDFLLVNKQIFAPPGSWSQP